MSQCDMGGAFFGKVVAKGIRAPGSESEAGLGSESGQAWLLPQRGAGQALDGKDGLGQGGVVAGREGVIVSG